MDDGFLRYTESGLLVHLEEDDHLGHPCLFLLGDDRAKTIQPTSQIGFIPSRREWEEIKQRIDSFYAGEDSAEIATHNLEIAHKHGLLPGSDKRRRIPNPPPAPLSSPVVGHIYFLLAENGRYKIGRATNLSARLKQLRTAAAVAFSLAHSIQSANTVLVEKLLHARFAAGRSHGEWFDLSPEDIEWIAGLTDFQLDAEVAA